MISYEDDRDNLIKMSKEEFDRNIPRIMSRYSEDALRVFKAARSITTIEEFLSQSTVGQDKYTQYLDQLKQKELMAKVHPMLSNFNQNG